MKERLILPSHLFEKREVFLQHSYRIPVLDKIFPGLVTGGIGVNSLHDFVETVLRRKLSGHSGNDDMLTAFDVFVDNDGQSRGDAFPHGGRVGE